MDKKINFILIILGVLVLTTIGGTLAFYGDIEKTSDNLFQTGAIDISIVPGGETVSLPALLEDMKPCTTKYITINVTNEFNSNPIHLWKKITNVNTEENGVPEPELAWYEDNSICPCSGKNDIDTVIEYDMTVNGQVLIDINQGLTISQVEDYYIYLGQLQPNETVEVVQSYHMKNGTENWAQSDKMSFEIEFLAQQIVAPSPVNELPGYEKPSE